MASAGGLVYVLESARIDSTLRQQIAQEVDELRRLEGGRDPATGEPFGSADRLLTLFLDRNVTDDDEMLVSYVGGEVRGYSANQFGERILSEMEYTEVVENLEADGGGTEVFQSPTFNEVWVTLVSVQAPATASSGALVIINYADDERSELNRTIQTYAVLTLLFLGLITLLARWRSGRLLAPLTQLRRTAEEIGETDLSLRIPETGHDDITALTRTINDMLARLEHAFVSQRRFLDDAGHELRTPLTVLQGHLELMDPADAHDVAETRALLLDEIDRMSRLVGDLILLAKSDRPDFLTVSSVDLGPLTHTLLSKARVLADRDWVLDDVAERICQLDEQRITQAVLQLTDNAVKHTVEGQQIAIGSSIGDDNVARIWVRDTGPGVPEAERGHIFERFGRAAVPIGDEGFGLGLSIVRAIAEAHGGQVTVASGPDGAGAQFELLLPQSATTSTHPSEEQAWHRS